MDMFIHFYINIYIYTELGSGMCILGSCHASSIHSLACADEKHGKMLRFRQDCDDPNEPVGKLGIILDQLHQYSGNHQFKCDGRTFADFFHDFVSTFFLFSYPEDFVGSVDFQSSLVDP